MPPLTEFRGSGFPEEQPAVEVDRLTFTYTPGLPYEVTSLKDVSLVIRKGDFYAVTGSTGSGKTTLVKHFNGLLLPTAGTVRVLGVSTAGKTARRELWKKVGLVFQQPEQQIFEETVSAEVAFGPKNMRLSPREVEERVDEALSLVGLAAEVKRLSPFALSGGQRRRAAIAGVLAMRPEILVLDEPGAGLDPPGRRSILAAIDRIRREKGTTVVFVTHNMEEVARLATRMAVFSKGRLLLEGTPRDVFARAAVLKEAGLDLPAPARLMRGLAAAGMPVRTSVLTLEEAEEEIVKVMRG
ncbi:MAG: energy-coupling factor transporter ATPase [Firmicutes bacterium]|nr:energy-coupling factor transporter ATPase [Bacillota bacterium]